MTKKLPTIFDPQTLSLDVCADFLHVRCILGDDVLVRYGSPHFEPSRARGDLPEHVARVSKPVRHLSEVRFSRPQLIAANEAFPEAAVADPIADLELWEEWNRGTRTFPYPGRYCRLGISTQEGKTTSPSSVGVLGEIMAGLFAQAGISPWVIVRVVRRWPDFIFYTPHDQGRHAFVEAKAFTTAPEGSPELFRRVHSNLLGEVAHQAVLQLNADPFVKVWGAFTHIASISPMKLRVTFIEFDCGDARRAGAVHRALPHAVVEGLATRALWQAASKMRDEELEELRSKSGRRSGGRFEAERRLTQIATEELKNLLLPGSGPVEVVQNSLEDLQREIETQAQSATYARSRSEARPDVGGDRSLRRDGARAADPTGDPRPPEAHGGR